MNISGFSIRFKSTRSLIGFRLSSKISFTIGLRGLSGDEPITIPIIPLLSSTMDPIGYKDKEGKNALNRRGSNLLTPLDIKFFMAWWKYTFFL